MKLDDVDFKGPYSIGINKVRMGKLTIQSDGDYYEYNPKDDITVFELAKFLPFMVSALSNPFIDHLAYLRENNLLRHFHKVNK